MCESSAGWPNGSEYRKHLVGADGTCPDHWRTMWRLFSESYGGTLATPYSRCQAQLESMSRVASLPRANRMVSRWFRGDIARFRGGFAVISRGFAPVSRVISRGFALVSRGFAPVSRWFRGSITVVSHGFAGFREVSQASAHIASHCIARYCKYTKPRVWKSSHAMGS